MVREGTFFKSDSLGLSSTNAKLAEGALFGFEVAPEEVSVPRLPLQTYLIRKGVTKVELVSMDIEDHEPKAFAGFDIDRFAPELLVIEVKNNQVEK